MPRLPHGQITTVDMVRQAREGLASRVAELGLAFAAAAPVDLQDFDFLFPTLQTDPANLLPESKQTVVDLKTLAGTMEDPDQPGGDNDSPIPAAYTYFGQFVDHDTTLEVQPGDLPPSSSGDLPHLLADDMARCRSRRSATRSGTSGPGHSTWTASMACRRHGTRPTGPRCASA
ncbi:MAG: hypothetical protein ACRDTX_31520, partial [Pseudonocardiaceae bacterium]